MKIAIFSIGGSEAAMLAESAERLGHIVKISQFQTAEDKQWLVTSDILIIRVYGKTFKMAEAVAEFFELHNPNGVISTTSKGVRESFDKYLAYKLFQEHTIPTPDTYLISSLDDVRLCADKLPLILKPRTESRGKGIHVVRDMEAFKDTAAALIEEYGSCIAQDFIEEASGTDIRAFVIGGEVVAAMERTAPEGSVTANLSKGGSARIITLDAATKQLAVRIAQLFESEFAGVDLLRTNSGMMVIENNSSPGFTIGKIANVDITTQIIEHLVQKKDNIL